MAGMIPNKKNLHQIEQEIEALRDRHNRSVDSWLKARFEHQSTTVDASIPTQSPYACCPDTQAHLARWIISWDLVPNSNVLPL